MSGAQFDMHSCAAPFDWLLRLLHSYFTARGRTEDNQKETCTGWTTQTTTREVPAWYLLKLFIHLRTERYLPANVYVSFVGEREPTKEVHEYQGISERASLSAGQGGVPQRQVMAMESNGQSQGILIMVLET